jgi:hypothetical protein
MKQDLKNPVDINNFSPGFLSAPLPFKCQITPRDEKVRKVVATGMQEADAVFKLYED